MTNLNPDGKFIIETGQGITQGIKKELDLSDEQCSILKKNSVWDQIIDEIDKQGSVKITRNQTNVQGPNKSNNFLVYTGDIIEFSKTCWNKILKLINTALNTNIQTLDNEKVNTDKEQTSAEKQAICLEAYNKILENFDKLDLPNSFDKTNIEQKLSQVYQSHLKDLPETVELRDITRSMLCELLEETGLPLMERYNIAGKNLNNIYPEDLVADNGLKLSTVSNNPDLQKNIETARIKTIESLKGLSNEDLDKIGIDSDKRDRLIGYLETIYYDAQETSNTMQALTIDGKPFISVNEKLMDYDNMANMITMLLHEANHCDREFLGRKAGNNKAEESECERIGCMTTALLIQRNALPYSDKYGNYQNYGRYPMGEKPHPFVDYIKDPTLFENDINNWVSGYTNYPDDDSCAITLEHNDKSLESKKIKIEYGDIVKIGNRELKIGQDCMLDGMNSQPIFQISCFNGEEGVSNIVFDDLKPSEVEKQRCGRSSLDENERLQKVVITRKQADGSEIVLCTGYVCGTSK